MNYSDLNIHLPKPSECASMLEDELQLEGKLLIERLQSALKAAGPYCEKANIMIFNQNLSLGDFHLITKYISTVPQKIYLSLLCSPEKFDCIETLARFKHAGLSAIKFHCYQQQITHSQHDLYLRVAEYARDLQIPILIDTSYGSLHMYDYDNLRLAAFIAKSIRTVPIVLLHSGGSRALEALLLAESSPNIYLETSFTLPYYIDSSVELDLAFAYKRIGAERVVYGSDYPYVKHSFSFQSAKSFLDRHSFSSRDQKQIFSGTFCDIFSN